MKPIEKQKTKSFIERLKDSVKHHTKIKPPEIKHKEPEEEHESLKSVVPNYPIFI